MHRFKRVFQVYPTSLPLICSCQSQERSIEWVMVGVKMCLEL